MAFRFQLIPQYVLLLFLVVYSLHFVLCSLLFALANSHFAPIRFVVFCQISFICSRLGRACASDTNLATTKEPLPMRARKKPLRADCALAEVHPKKQHIDILANLSASALLRCNYLPVSSLRIDSFIHALAARHFRAIISLNGRSEAKPHRHRPSIITNTNIRWKLLAISSHSIGCFRSALYSR